ncbi:DUF6765 family protein [Propionivibrio dicarboxylicus]|uniref:Uncharacterized protein n=1 Tax=Propionivibrio dicarboxylicus TaxID=83767 RepID=A0A1G8EML1_9RHOO|nr:DUF6765 family protein [Propionivibrio dicarboxylicus]SDH71110.1 hypothetical protein SAMN05660652_02131 [Propionivibrio dicarboxylicus]
MQTDMHYYGTYALARAAGIKPEAAMIIATAAQYVDDFKGVSKELADNAYVGCRATAHGITLTVETVKDTAQNVDHEDQRHVWSPFHFLPGCEGTTIAERMICRKDSKVAQTMVAHHLDLSNEDFGLVLIGITAHVYADTFAHFGFSGISNVMNEVDGRSFDLSIKSSSLRNYVWEKASDFWDACKGQGAELLTKLGHGGAATFPDRPYLTWRFRYSDGRDSDLRNNQDTFLAACEKLHTMFLEFGKRRPEFSNGDPIVFSAIKEAVREILSCEGTMEERIDAWQTAAREGLVFANPGKAAIPTYDPVGYDSEIDHMHTLSSTEVHSSPLFTFIRAAEVHRNYVLNELLPLNGLKAVFP